MGGKLFTQSWYDRVEALIALALSRVAAATGGGGAGSIRVNFAAPAASASSATDLPAGAEVSRTVVVVTTPFDAGATIEVGDSGSAARYQATADNDPQGAAGSQYDVPAIVSVPAASPVVVTIGGAPADGEGFALVFYTKPLA
jgi:hypothetical protein